MRNRLLRYRKRASLWLRQYGSSMMKRALLAVIGISLIYVLLLRQTKPDLKIEKISPPVQRSPPTQYSSRLGMIYNETDRVQKEQGFREHAFNTLVSNRIGLYRLLPDTRHPLCKNQTYSTSGLDASVIVCFYNEHLITLLRTVYSVLERTAEAMLKEIILIDDYSGSEYLPLKVHSTFLPLVHFLVDKIEEMLDNHRLKANKLFLTKVRYYRLPERSGLIRARLYGAARASGSVLFFIDSHCEVNTGWLPPLLNRIEINRNTIVCPIIDLIDSDTFAYSSSPLVKGGFNW